MDGELKQDRQQDVKVENVAKRSLLAESLHGLGSGDAKETNRHEHSCDSDLVVAKLDTVEVLDRERVCSDQTVESENLVHLDGRHKRASSLSDNVGD